MKTKSSKPASIHVLSAFWDTSAVVALCCVQKQTAQAKQTARIYARQVVWWGTSVEAISALNRLIRQSHLTAAEIPQAFAKLDYLRKRWVEIEPASEVRNQAERLLGNYKLRAGDAFQLAAASVWCGGYPRGRSFIGSDNDWSIAAEAEGFNVICVL